MNKEMPGNQELSPEDKAKLQISLSRLDISVNPRACEKEVVDFVSTIDDALFKLGVRGNKVLSEDMRTALEVLRKIESPDAKIADFV